MGKLMQRLVHGMLPSWLTKVKKGAVGEDGSGKKVKALPAGRKETELGGLLERSRASERSSDGGQTAAAEVRAEPPVAGADRQKRPAAAAARRGRKRKRGEEVRSVKRRRGAQQQAVVVREEELPARLREVVGGGSAVVMVCSEPAREFRESMAEMIVGNGLSHLPDHLHFLLFCYLSLNEPHLHRLIRSTFLQVLRTATPPPPLP